ncbi:uncharacterized protein EV154DRAFT_245880 [Mucor mucedo]|uniref:uncharacterized protein n=1 Tax=Mucor mucedo TaxID=29922 RepID=UPI0022201DDA|nr:uncharacterized protein EV154DRAFT_245880 [Mucor mucedo]KAI7890722.1 hypothetical protein EV154DRAFT_245880 [Mucor mucedo]
MSLQQFSQTLLGYNTLNKANAISSLKGIPLVITVHTLCSIVETLLNLCADGITVTRNGCLAADPFFFFFFFFFFVQWFFGRSIRL